MRRRASVFATVRPARSSRRPRLRNPLQVNLNTVTCMTMPCCIRLSLSLSLSSPLSLSLSLWILLERMYVWSAVYSDALVCIRFPCGRITIIRCPIRSGSAAGHCPAPRPTAGHTAATRTARTAARRRAEVRVLVCVRAERAALGRCGTPWGPHRAKNRSRAGPRARFLATVKPAAGYEHVTFRLVIGLTWFFQRFFQFFGNYFSVVRTVRSKSLQPHSPPLLDALRSDRTRHPPAAIKPLYRLPAAPQ